ncbi:MAG: MmcQ/YjbR family DNA-binding protein [Spirochaetales bacterium]|nr:MmcQ/YjbR family DNA-binding protein [Candidatus Physcosoma equi]
MKREELFTWVKEQYGTEPDYPWMDLPSCCVLRNRENKWYGLVMDIPGRRLGLEDDEIVDVLNVKADPELIDMLVDNVGFFRAYHMSKTKWISILLDGTVPDETVKNLVADSYTLVHKKKVRASKEKKENA